MEQIYNHHIYQLLELRRLSNSALNPSKVTTIVMSCGWDIYISSLQQLNLDVWGSWSCKDHRPRPIWDLQKLMLGWVAWGQEQIIGVSQHKAALYSNNASYLLFFGWSCLTFIHLDARAGCIVDQLLTHPLKHRTNIYIICGFFKKNPQSEIISLCSSRKPYTRKVQDWAIKSQGPEKVKLERWVFHLFVNT